MSTHPNPFERYTTIIWRTLCTTATAVGEFAIRALEIIAKSFGSLIKAVAWLALATAGIVIALAFAAYLIAQSIGLSDSPAFQAFRDEKLQTHLPPNAMPATSTTSTDKAMNE